MTDLETQMLAALKAVLSNPHATVALVREGTGKLIGYDHGGASIWESNKLADIEAAIAKAEGQ